MTEDLVTVRALARLLKVTPRTVRIYAKDGTLPPPMVLRPGPRPRLRWRATDIETWLNERAEDREAA